jgi:hypothetical protein
MRTTVTAANVMASGRNNVGWLGCSRVLEKVQKSIKSASQIRAACAI